MLHRSFTHLIVMGMMLASCQHQPVAKPFRAEGRLSAPRVTLAPLAWKAPNGETREAWSVWNDLGSVMVTPTGPIYMPSGSDDSSRLQMSEGTSISHIRNRVTPDFAIQLDRRLKATLKKESGWLGSFDTAGSTRLEVVIDSVQLQRQPALAGFRLHLRADVSLTSSTGKPLYRSVALGVSQSAAPLGAMTERADVMPRLSSEALDSLATQIVTDLKRSVRE